jgi:hypothetical protein
MEMGIKNVRQGWLALCFLFACGLTACHTSTAPAGSADAANAGTKGLAPQRVDVRGSIIMRRYDQGQVMLEVEGFPSQHNRYNRAYVLVLPTTQIIGTDGKLVSLSELQQGQNVAILLRSGGNGNQVGVGVARKMWVEEAY